MPVDRTTGEFIYHNDYEVKDFYIRFPHYEKNALFMPVIRYGRRYGHKDVEVYQRMYMPLYDWQRLFEAEGVDLKAISESENQEYHFVKTILIHRIRNFFDAVVPDDDEDAQQRVLLDGGGDFFNLDAEWFVFKSLLNADNDLTSEISELVDKADETIV